MPHNYNTDYNRELAHRYTKTLRDAMRTKRATRVGLAEGEITVKYHDTIVFRYYVDTGDVELDTGGWYSYTTKARLNECLAACDIPAGVYQETRPKRADDAPYMDKEWRRTWYVWHRPTDRRYVLDGSLHFKRSHCFPFGEHRADLPRLGAASRLLGDLIAS